MSEKNFFFREAWNSIIIFRELWKGRFIFRETWSIPPLYHPLDIWRIRNSNRRRYTWKQKKPVIQRRLDCWLISDDFQDDVDNTDIISAIKTDHAAIVLHINSIEKQPPCPSYWKFNSSLLDDPKYIDLIKDNVPLWLTEFKEVLDNLDKNLLWDLIKYK